MMNINNNDIINNIDIIDEHQQTLRNVDMLMI